MSSTTSGNYQYNVMANVPAVFQSFMNDVFWDMLNRSVIVYLDDILIHSRTYHEHVRHMGKVLQCMCKHRL